MPPLIDLFRFRPLISRHAAHAVFAISLISFSFRHFADYAAPHMILLSTLISPLRHFPLRNIFIIADFYSQLLCAMLFRCLP
jgi:hypothetical protein